VVYDLLVADRQRSEALIESEPLGVFWNVYDSAVREKRWNDPGVRRHLELRYPFIEKALKWIDQIEFFDGVARRRFFGSDEEDSMGQVFRRVVDAWKPLGICPALDRTFSAWKEDLLTMAASTRPYWIFDRDPGSTQPITTLRDVFISYAHEDIAFVKTLAHKLGLGGVPVWWDPALRAGDEYEKELKNRVEVCQALLVVVSPSSNRSSYVKKEIGWATQFGKRMITIQLAGKLPERLRHLQAIAADDERLVERLVQGIR
jgi:hypothetical protein